MNRLFCFFIVFFFFPVAGAYSQPLSPNTEQRLLSFCELYSTVKYYYPDPGLHGFPWDAFAWQGYKIAKTSKSDKEFIRRTDSLFRIIAPGVQISSKKFNLAPITPKDASLYPERAFWQHQSGLNVDTASFSNASALNYIYKKPVDIYRMGQTIAAKPKGLLGKRLRVSLMAKVEGNSDSIIVCSFNTVKGKGAKKRVIIKAAGNEWKRYAAEIEHPDSIIFSTIVIYHPKKGTVYVDDLKLERFENGDWEKIEIENGGFEGYSSSGRLGRWDNMYVLGALAVADSINAVEGKYCLKLPAVEDKLLYPPAPIDQPYAVSLPEGYKAYVPLQLYADENRVFPAADRQALKNFTEKFKQNPLNARQSAIACAMQTWAALYQDYPYREAGFENKLNRLLCQTVNKLDTDAAANPSTVLVFDFLTWINDPHLRLEGFPEFPKDDSLSRKIINLPVRRPGFYLTENQCVVTNVIDSVTKLQAGDVILQINGVNIDSLLQLYRASHISRAIQSRNLERLMKTYGESEMKVRLLRKGETVDVVFSDYTKPKGGISLKEEREKYQAMQDSLKEAKGVFYLNANYPSEAFNPSLTKSTERILDQYRATNTLITELNQSKALILDVRGQRRLSASSILPFFNACMGIDLNRKIDILKTAFYPVARFKRDTLDYVAQKNRKDMLIRVPVYVLIDYYTLSAPERELVNLKKSGRATFIGCNTAGAAGIVNKTKITDKITLVYTTGQVVGVDDNPMSYQGTGIAPDIYVYPTPQGIAEGRDEVLEKAIEIALKNTQEKE